MSLHTHVQKVKHTVFLEYTVAVCFSLCYFSFIYIELSFYIQYRKTALLPTPIKRSRFHIIRSVFVEMPAGCDVVKCKSPFYSP